MRKLYAEVCGILLCGGYGEKVDGVAVDAEEGPHAPWGGVGSGRPQSRRGASERHGSLDWACCPSQEGRDPSEGRLHSPRVDAAPSEPATAAGADAVDLCRILRFRSRDGDPYP